MNLKELESIVKNIIDNDIFKQKLEDYTYLIDNLRVNSVATNEIYKGKYREFFAFKRGIKKEKKEEYFQYLDTVKSSKKISLEQSEKIYNDICLITGRAEVSFSSKLIHVIDTSYPIYDSVVGDEHFDYKRINYGTFERRKQKNLQMYKNYCKSFIRYTNSPDGQKIIELFDKKVPEYKDVISDVKKVDFVLWRDEDGKIEIPQEFKCQR